MAKHSIAQRYNNFLDRIIRAQQYGLILFSNAEWRENIDQELSRSIVENDGKLMQKIDAVLQSYRYRYFSNGTYQHRVAMLCIEVAPAHKKAEIFQKIVKSPVFSSWNSTIRHFFTQNSLEMVPRDKRIDTVRNIIKSEEYAGWNPALQHEFLENGMTVAMAQNTDIWAILQADESLFVACAAGTIDRTSDATLTFNTQSGVSMTTGYMKKQTVAGAAELVEYYKERPELRFRLAFTTATLIDKAKILGLPEALLEKMRSERDILAPKGLTAAQRHSFEQEISSITLDSPPPPAV